MLKSVRATALVGVFAAGLLAVSAPAVSANADEGAAAATEAVSASASDEYGPYYYDDEETCHYVGRWYVRDGYSAYGCYPAWGGGWDLYLWT
ncbi:hypothetical protein AB0D49_20940 [Streptomyces sp. NPDC048290]|uniref:hypothetical protein n=1 Tax=Streptomyces sp. NPDC048290 TaxID=3155811 RepID=UPI0034260A23